MKKFEACLYNPTGTVRDLEPVSNNDLQELSVPILNQTTSKAITKGNIEIHSGTSSRKIIIFVSRVLFLLPHKTHS